MIRKINLLMIIAVLFIFIISSTIYADANDSNGTITGDYQYSSSIGGVQLQNKFEYRDDCFTRSSYLGCKHLESLSIQVAASSISFYSEGKDIYEIDTEDNAHNVIDFLTKMKFEDVETNQYYKTEKRENSMGVCVGQKSIMQDGNSYTLLAIVPRSAGYKQEWAGNFTIGDGDIHEGFKAARDEILRFVKQYINNNKIEGKIKVWISGYSRGAAISDMLGGFFAGGGIDYFEDVVSITPEDVYCYTIGTPRTIKDGLDKNIELSVSANRDEAEYKDDTQGEEFIYTKGGKVVVGDKIYGGLRNLISSSDSFPLLPPEEWGYTHYGNRIDPTEGLSSIEDVLEELKSISDYVYDIYTENNELKKLKLKTFDLKTLSIVEKGKKVNPADFMKEKVDGMAKRIGSSKDYNDKHYQEGLKSFVGAYGLLAPILNDTISGDSISTGDAIKTLLYTYVAYTSELLQEEGIVHDDKEAIAIIIKDLLEHFLEIEIDIETFTIDDLFANVTKYLADNMDEPVGKKAISGIISSIPEQYKGLVFQAFGRFHKDYYMNNDTYEINPDVTNEDIIKEYIRACAYGADPECTIDDNFREPKQARTALYTAFVMATANNYPEIVSLLFDERYQPDGHGLLIEAIDLLISNLLVDKDDKGEIVKEYENISQLADEGLLKLLELVQRNAVDISEDIYGEEYSKALKFQIDGLKKNITEARKAISTLLLYQSGRFNAVASLEGALSIIDDAMTVVMSHLDEVYLAYSRTSERYEEHFPVISGDEEMASGEVSGDVSGEEIIEEKYHKVLFELNNGELSKDYDNPLKVLDGKCIIKPENPTRENYRFDDWYIDQELTTKFEFDKPIVEDIVIYAKWYKKSTGGGSYSTKKAKKDADEAQEFAIWSNASEWATKELTKANEKGLIPATFANKDFTKAITRKDFAAVAVKLYESISNTKAELVMNNPFVDTDDEYVLKAYAIGVTLGTSETTFTPNEEITREQMATMLTRVLLKLGINTKYDITNDKKYADDNDLSDWGRPSVYFMAKEEIIKGIGDNRFNGLGNAKVEEAIAIAYRCAERFILAQ
ncbi:MAG: InlB B-repeat-containing protein [Clostridia bacterium]|nr:InlB B-repeat-containing protein [Clostridia bacterium]